MAYIGVDEQTLNDVMSRARTQYEAGVGKLELPTKGWPLYILVGATVFIGSYMIMKKKRKGKKS